MIAINSRYNHRIAISNTHILGIDNESVAFRYTDYADGRRVKIMRLAGVELLRPEHRNRPGEPHESATFADISPRSRPPTGKIRDTDTPDGRRNTPRRLRHPEHQTIQSP